MTSSPTPKWNPIKWKCRKCEDVIWSKHPGHFIGCKCGTIAVDQTRYYTRFIGNDVNDFIQVDDNIPGRRDDNPQQGPSV